MKIKFVLVLALAFLGLAPAVSYAAYNDVSLTSDTVITASGVNLSIVAPTAVLQSIVVNGSSLDVVMPGNSFLKLTSTDRRNFTATNFAPVVQTSSCTDSASTYTYESPAEASAIAFTITIESSTCTTNSAGGGGSPGGGGGGGGGGGSSYYSAPVTAAVTKPAAAAVTTKPATQAAAVAQAAPKASVTAPAAVSAISGTITRVLSKGITNPQVRVLQQILNSDADTRIAASGAGSPGSETEFLGPATTRAVQKFQVKYGIAKVGDEGYGNVGPKTQAKLNEVAVQAVLGVPAAVPAVAPASVPAIISVPSGATLSRPLSRGATNAEVKTLQQALNSDPDTQVASSGVGSPGNETMFLGPATTRAVQKFQVKYGLAGPGDEGYGNVGPKTRTKINELLSGGMSAPATPTSVAPSTPAPSSSSAASTALQKQIDDAMKQIKALQEQLKTAQ
ncbi:peptidoglycan-binding protein [Candidatus Uhrbacteria bacterium]|nr:peptidoglycan-binding protein [Candidatus Uhrbacteria bacterium]